MSTINRYRFFCPTEQTYIYVWNTNPPSFCPNDHALIDSNSLVVVQTISENTTIIKEPTSGYYRSESIVMNIPKGTVGDISTHDFSWPIDIQIWKNDLVTLDNQIGDSVSVVINPDTIIGTLISDASIGQTVINVSPTVVTTAVKGFNAVLTDGLIKNDLGFITSVDTVNSQITFSKPLTNDFSTSTPTYVQINIIIIKNQSILKAETIEYGTKGLKYMTLSANDIMRVYYTNNDGIAKICNWRIEYYIPY